MGRPTLEQEIARILAPLPPEAHGRALTAALQRVRGGHGFPSRAGPGSATPGALAGWVTAGREMQAPHLDLIDRAFVDIADGTLDRVLITLPPRHGKTRRASRWGPLWYLRRFPDRRVALASYGAELADEHGRWIRDQIEQYDGTDGTLDLGLRLAASSKAANRWNLDGHEGGMVTTGIGGALTGRGMHLGICDDPFKDAADASSPTMRRRAWEWWQSTFLTRLEPGGAIILILTRWDEDDIAGRLLADADEAGRWRVINLPALAETDDDLLGRARGEALWPERYDEAALAEIRRRVGGRVWSALYQQRPAPVEGAVWKRAWFDHCRPDQVPQLAQVVVSIDPSVTEDGSGDAAGIIVGGRGVGENADRAWVLADRTLNSSPAQWGRAACLAFLEFDATGFIAEGNQGYALIKLVLQVAWKQLQDEEVIPKDRALPGIRIVHAKTGKRTRAEPVAALYEAGHRVQHAADLGEMEGEMCTWLGGNDSPNRMDAAVWLLTYLMGLGGAARLSRPTGSLRR